jgi:hypothetical protein
MNTTRRMILAAGAAALATGAAGPLSAQAQAQNVTNTPELYPGEKAL